MSGTDWTLVLLVTWGLSPLLFFAALAAYDRRAERRKRAAALAQFTATDVAWLRDRGIKAVSDA